MIVNFLIFFFCFLRNQGKRSDRSSRDRTRDRDRDRDRRRDRSPRDRSRDRSKDRRRDRSRDHRRRSPSDDSRSRRRRRDSRSRSPARRRDREVDKEKEKEKDEEREKLREEEREKEREWRRQKEAEYAIEREKMKKQREIDDLTKDQRTIFVGQLTKKANEKDLERFFGQIGKVNNIIMLRDKISGHHKGFGYVEMGDLDTIPNCLLFNNVVPDFQKFPILVKASEAEKNFQAKKEAIGDGPDTRIYVGNIHISLDDMSLQAIVEQFGPVESCKIHRDHLGNSKGFAFVKFAKYESTQMAMQALGGLEVAGRPLKVGPVVDSGGQSVGPDGTSANWKLDADEGGAGLALNSISRMELMAKLGQGAGLSVPQPLPAVPVAPAKPAIPPIGGVPSVCLLLCNMFDPATETGDEWDLDIKEDVMEECSKFGTVVHCLVETKKPGGLVYLKFKEVSVANGVAKSMNGRFFAGRMITATFLEPSVYADLTR